MPQDSPSPTTTITTTVDPPSEGPHPYLNQQPLEDQQPPGSLHIPIDLARNLIPSILHRDGSTRDLPSTPTTNPKPIPHSSSRRLSSSSTRAPPPLLSLPNLPLARSARRSTRCPPSPHAHLIPRNLDKAHPPSDDPSSPKVSCFGKIQTSNKSSPPERPPFRDRCSLWLLSWCCCHGRRRKNGAVESVEEDDEEEEVGRSDVAEAKKVEVEVVVVEPPVLAGMKRFASGRRSAAWAEEAVERSEPSDGRGGRPGGKQLDDVDHARSGKATLERADDEESP